MLSNEINKKLYFSTRVSSPSKTVGSYQIFTACMLFSAIFCNISNYKGFCSIFLINFISAFGSVPFLKLGAVRFLWHACRFCLVFVIFPATNVFARTSSSYWVGTIRLFFYVFCNFQKIFWCPSYKRFGSNFLILLDGRAHRCPHAYQ